MNKRHDDKDLSIAERRVIFLRKYGVVGALSLVAPMLAPIGVEWIAGSLIDKKLAPIERKIDKLHEELTYTRTLLLSASTKKMVTAEDWNIFVRHRIRSQSLDKVKQIQQLFDEGHKGERLWKKVKNILMQETNIYVAEMRSYVHPVAGNIANYLADTFPMNKNVNRKYRPDYSFLDTVESIIMSKNIDDKYKTGDILEYMKAIQNEYFTDHYDILKEMEHKAKFRTIR